MNTPEEFRQQMAEKTDQQLLDMLARPDDWTSQALYIAKEELQGRNVRFIEVAPSQPEQKTDLELTSTMTQDLKPGDLITCPWCGRQAKFDNEDSCPQCGTRPVKPPMQIGIRIYLISFFLQFPLLFVNLYVGFDLYKGRPLPAWFFLLCFTPVIVCCASLITVIVKERTQGAKAMRKAIGQFISIMSVCLQCALFPIALHVGDTYEGQPLPRWFFLFFTPIAVFGVSLIGFLEEQTIYRLRYLIAAVIASLVCLSYTYFGNDGSKLGGAGLSHLESSVLFGVIFIIALNRIGKREVQTKPTTSHVKSEPAGQSPNKPGKDDTD